MIYGDKKYEKDEKRYPDYTAVLQSSNLYGYCMGNPVKYYDKTGNIITEAGILVYAAWVALNIAVDVAAGYVAIKFTDLALQEQNKIKKAVSYNDIPASYYIKWNKDDNGKNHVINGSRVGSEKNHLPIWKKLGYDPKDPKGYDKLLAIFKTVVNSGYIKSTQRCYDHGKQIGMYILYENDFVSKGVSVCVKIYTSLETGYSYFSDAWGEIIGK